MSSIDDLQDVNPPQVPPVLQDFVHPLEGGKVRARGRDDLVELDKVLRELGGPLGDGGEVVDLPLGLRASGDDANGREQREAEDDLLHVLPVVRMLSRVSELDPISSTYAAHLGQPEFPTRASSRRWWRATSASAATGSSGRSTTPTSAGLRP
jgi:hypothetical protein